MAASAGGTGTPPPSSSPLRLKDLLELDCDSCSAAGFRCYPRRLVCDSSAAAQIAMRRRPSSKLSHLSRSLSRRLSKSGFWRRREEDEDEEDAAAAPTTATAASSADCGCTSSVELELETSSESSDNRSGSESDSVFSSSATEDCSVHYHPSPSQAEAATEHDEHEVAMKRRVSKEGSEADDKEQLSPVGVMDFPFDDDDDELMRDAGVACSPSFSLERLQTGRKTHKIRRLGSRDDDELAPLDLEALLAATSESDPDDVVPAQQMLIVQCRTEDAETPVHETSSSSSASGIHDVAVPDEDDDLISLLMSTVSAGLDSSSSSSERLLLLDFFLEMKRRRSEAHADLPGPGAGLLRRRKAAGWVGVEGEAATIAPFRWGLTDVLSAGPAIVEEMERSRRWMHVGEEEREVGAVVAGMLADELVGEVVREFLFV